MSLKVAKSLTKTRPFAKELKLAEFRKRYVIFLTLWLCGGLFPSILWISLGRQHEIMPVEIMGYLWLITGSLFASKKFYNLYEARLMDIYPSIQKLSKAELKKLSFLVNFSSIIPFLNFYLLGLLWRKKRSRKEVPYWVVHPLKSLAVITTISVLPTILSIQLSLNSPSFTPKPRVPSLLSYWISNGSISAINHMHNDAIEVTSWINTVDAKVKNNKIDHAQVNEIYAKKFNSKKVTQSPIAPIILGSGNIQTLTLFYKNYRSISSERESDESKLFIYENIARGWKNWKLSPFYGFNPALFINPLFVPEFVTVSLSLKYANSKIKNTIRTKTIEGLDQLSKKYASLPSALSTKSKIKKLKRELETD